MRCYQRQTENYQSDSRRKSINNNWMALQELYLQNHHSIEYLKRYKSLSKTDKWRLELVSFIENHQKAGRTLFHLTLTYKNNNDYESKESDVNKFFKTFYLNYFLPHLLQTKHFNRNNWRQFQPICLAFVDGISSEPNQHELRTKKPKGHKIRSRLPALLHHHAILAVHEQNVENLLPLVGENTFANSVFGYKIMTSDLKQCDATRLLYSSKKMDRFPDFMSFPDRMSSERSECSASAAR